MIPFRTITEKTGQTGICHKHFNLHFSKILCCFSFRIM